MFSVFDFTVHVLSGLAAADMWVAFAGPLTHAPMILFWVMMLIPATYAVTGSTHIDLVMPPLDASTLGMAVCFGSVIVSMKFCCTVLCAESALSLACKPSPARLRCNRRLCNALNMRNWLLHWRTSCHKARRQVTRCSAAVCVVLWSLITCSMKLQHICRLN